MKLRHYLDVLEDKNTIKILRVLNNTNDGLSGRDIALRADIPQASCSRCLNKLTESRLISFKVYGRSNIYYLRDSWYLNNVLAPLFQQEKKMFSDVLINAIRNDYSKFCHGIVLFGSYAKHCENLNSDIDICFIAKEGEKETLDNSLIRTSLEFESEFLVTLSPVIFTLGDFVSYQNTPLIKDIIEEGSWISGSLGGLLSYEENQSKEYSEV